jgi:hypothetical protein
VLLLPWLQHDHADGLPLRRLLSAVAVADNAVLICWVLGYCSACSS